MSTIWITSDPHFHHKNIIKYASRPFKDLEEMNATIVENWNSVVRKQDKVFLLGDVGFGSLEMIQPLVSKLRGTIILIRGNHDKGRSDDYFSKCGISKVYRHPIIFKNFYILSHAPVYLNEHMPYVNIHGHIHEKTIVGGGNYFNACVEQHNYFPVKFEDIRARFEGAAGTKELLQPLNAIHEGHQIIL